MTYTPLQILKRLLRGYLGNRLMSTETLYVNNTDIIYLYDSANNSVREVSLEKDREVPLIRIQEDIDDVLYSPYGNSRYMAVILNENGPDEIYLCRYMMCTKYKATTRKSGLLDDMATPNPQEKVEESADIVYEYDIDRELTKKVKSVHWHLLKMIFDHYSENMIEKEDISHLALANFKYIPLTVYRQMIILRTKNMTPYLAKHRLIEIKPIAEFDDGTQLYFAPRSAYLLGEYTAMAIVMNTERMPKTDIRKITMHQVLEQIAKRRL